MLENSIFSLLHLFQLAQYNQWYSTAFSQENDILYQSLTAIAEKKKIILLSLLMNATSTMHYNNHGKEKVCYFRDAL